MSARQVQGSLFGDLEEVGAPSPNPMVRRFGPGPQGAVCRDCRWLQAFEYSRVYYKCELRGISHGAATDHRVRWPVCGQFIRVVR